MNRALALGCGWLAAVVAAALMSVVAGGFGYISAAFAGLVGFAITMGLLKRA